MREMEKLRVFVEAGVTTPDDVRISEEMGFDPEELNYRAVEFFNTLVVTVNLLAQVPSPEEMTVDNLPSLPFDIKSGIDLTSALVTCAGHLMVSAAEAGHPDRSLKYIYIMKQATELMTTLSSNGYGNGSLIEMMDEVSRAKLQSLIAAFVVLMGYVSSLAER